MAPAASFVCRVLKTRWPVTAACTAIAAVSSSRISPTMMMSGDWRRIERRPRAKVSPTSAWVCTWLMPCNWYSTGSSMVTTFTSLVFNSWSAE